MVIIRDSEFRIVSRSCNLRGVHTYNRAHPAERIDIYPHANGAQVGIVFMDGASCVTDFASARVAREWAESKRRFPLATVTIHTKD